MTKIFAIIIMGILSTCNGTKKGTIYNYNGITIKRFDTNSETNFFYEKANGDVIPGKIYVQYSGINDGFSGYLIFKKNGKVELLSGDGYFQFQNIDTNKFTYRRIIAAERPNILDSVYYINLIINNEKLKNKRSSIKANYNY